MARTREWAKSGDRSHPNLKLVDSFKRQLTYPRHNDHLLDLERYHLDGDTYLFDQCLHKVTESQQIYEGDRSHPRMVQLDNILPSLNYNGWERDRDKAMKEHIANKEGFAFKRMIIGMKRKQALHIDDRTHPSIQYVDSLSPSYPGWEKDVKSMLDCHITGYCIDWTQFRITEKQRMHEGNRSHPRLVALDALSLTYPGWEADAKEVERRHIVDFWCSTGLNENCKAMLSRLKRKQLEFATGVEDRSSMHPILRTIVETKWTYPNWQKDIEEARKNFHVLLFEQDLEKCQLRQMLHEGDFRHHPALIMLTQLDISYPDCIFDIRDTNMYLTQHGYHGYSKKHFNQMIQGMKNKQIVYNGLERPKQKKAPRSDSRLGTCVICLEASRTHVFVPCGHICVCEQCSHKVKGNTCPMCKQAATMTMEVFLP